MGAHEKPLTPKHMKYYKAPWGISLLVISSFLTVICLGTALVAFWHGGNSFWLGVGMLAMVVGCALFAIRGYTVTPDALLVHRLVWTTRLPLAGLQSAQFQPNAMRWSIRTFGNGGFFSISGFYWNKLLGAYRALATNGRQTVVLRYSGRTTVVVSPSSPEEFAHEFGTL